MANLKRIEIIDQIQDNLERLDELNPEWESNQEEMKELCDSNAALNATLKTLPANG